jgi:hypothetical protein
MLYVNVDEPPLGELLSMLPDTAVADRLEAEMDAALGVIDPTSGADLDAARASVDRMLAVMDHIRETARHALMDGTAVLGRQARTKRLTIRDKLELLPPFEAAQIKAEARAALGNIGAFLAVMVKLDAAVALVRANAN